LPTVSNSRADAKRHIETAIAELKQLRSVLTDFEVHGLTEEISADLMYAILRDRRRREAIFGADVFGDPAWDLLLALYAGLLQNEELAVTRLCETASVAVTTGLRWLSQLQRMGLIDRRSGRRDRRVTVVALSKLGMARMEEYFAKAGVEYR